MADPIKRVAVLFSRLSGYMAACLKTLKDEYDVELLVIRWVPAREAPFDASHFAWIDTLHNKQDLSRDELFAAVHRFDPQAILMVGWMDSDYLDIARQVRKQGVPVVAGCDTQWNGSIRQQLGRLTSRWYLHPAIDVLWVAGERQRQLAARLGFRGRRCWSGYYTCQWEAFSALSQQRSVVSGSRSFLYVGRYLEIKAIDVLARAYRRYREQVDDPWPLICAGAGPLAGLLADQEGIHDKGFVQPDRLPELIKDASAFVLPSRREPWGVVVHEAASAGLPLICSDACGSAVHLLQDGYNGFVVEAGNIEHLTQAMVRMTEQSHQQLERMGLASYELSKQFTPQRWARTFYEGIRSWGRRMRAEGATELRSV